MLLAVTEWTLEKFSVSLGVTAAFGLLGIALLVFGFKLFEFVTPKLDVEQKLQDGSVAVAITVAALLIAISIVASAAISG